VKSLAWPLACATLLVAVACGSDSGDDVAAEPFLGSWTYTDGTESTDCGGPPSEQPLMGSLTVTRGPASALIMMIGADCRLALDIDGATATARPSPPCTVDGGSVSLTFTKYTFAINGTTATETRMATAQATTPTGPVACSYSANGTLTKAPK
jgi:hypothetical protein